MGSGSLKRLGAFAVGLYLFVPSTAMGHAYVMQPISRDTGITNLDARAHKTGPCGNSPRTNMPTQYAVGQEIEVKLQETIDHQGCFQIRFSAADDKDWVLLSQIDDPAGSQDDRVVTTKVKLPEGVSCKDCTLQVLQLMIGRACAANETPAAGSTYFSCADIRVGDFPDAGPTMPPSDGGTDDDDGGTSSGGVSTTPTDGGGKTGNGSGSRRLTPVENDDGGCSMTVGSASTTLGGFSLFAPVAFGALAMVRRLRRRR